MALSIKSDEADRLARELSALTGETLTDTVTLRYANGSSGSGHAAMAGRSTSGCWRSGARALDAPCWTRALPT